MPTKMNASPSSTLPPPALETFIFRCSKHEARGTRYIYISAPPHDAMRFLLLAAAFIAPCCIDSFALQHRAPVRANAVRATSSSHRCCSSTVMTLPSSLNRLAGTVLLGGALLATGVVTGQAEAARADVSISPRCEYSSVDPFLRCTGEIGDRIAESCDIMSPCHVSCSRTH